jgi:hypothetical protein
MAVIIRPYHAISDGDILFGNDVLFDGDILFGGDSESNR